MWARKLTYPLSVSMSLVHPMVITSTLKGVCGVEEMVNAGHIELSSSLLLHPPLCAPNPENFLPASSPGRSTEKGLPRRGGEG